MSPGQQPLRLLPGEPGAALAAQAVHLELLLQLQPGGIIPIVAQAEFLPPVHPVQLLPEGGVIGGVKVQAGHPVAPVRPGVGVVGKQLAQPAGEHQILRGEIWCFHSWRIWMGSVVPVVVIGIVPIIAIVVPVVAVAGVVRAGGSIPVVVVIVGDAVGIGAVVGVVVVGDAVGVGAVVGVVIVGDAVGIGAVVGVVIVGDAVGIGAVVGVVIVGDAVGIGAVVGVVIVGDAVGIGAVVGVVIVGDAVACGP